MEPEICMKMLRNLSERLAAKFPTTTLSYSMVKIAHLDDAFSEIFELEASPIWEAMPIYSRFNHHNRIACVQFDFEVI